MQTRAEMRALMVASDPLSATMPPFRAASCAFTAAVSALRAVAAAAAVAWDCRAARSEAFCAATAAARAWTSAFGACVP